MAADQKRSPIYLGFTPATPNAGTTTLALNGAASGGYSATWLALGFRLDQAKTLSKVQVYCSAVAGTLGANDLVCDVYSSSVGAPNASLQSVNTVTATPVTGSPAWVEFAGFTQSLTAGIQYWLVLRNAGAGSSGTSNPTVTYPTYQWGGAGTSSVVANGSSPHVGWAKVHSITSGAAWTTNLQAAVSSCRLQFSDGTYDGFPVQAIAPGADKVYGNVAGSGHEVGVQFTVPPNVKLNVRGLVFWTNVSGSPTGNLLYRLYQNNNLVATSQGIINSDVVVSGVAYYPDYFASTVTLNPGDVVTCTIADSAADSSSNAFIMGDEYKFASDPNTLALMPFEGTLQKVTTSTGGGASTPTFSTNNQSIFPFALLLDSAGEFTSAGGGGGVPRIGPDLIGGICG